MPLDCETVVGGQLVVLRSQVKKERSNSQTQDETGARALCTCETETAGAWRDESHWEIKKNPEP